MKEPTVVRLPKIILDGIKVRGKVYLQIDGVILTLLKAQLINEDPAVKLTLKMLTEQFEGIKDTYE